MNDPLLLSNKNVRNFLLLCDLKSFSAVAETLGITQSAVSKSIAALEETVGFPLVERDRRPVIITRKAMILRSQLLDVGQVLSQTLERLRAVKISAPIIRIGVLEALSSTLLPSLVKDLQDRYAEVIVHTGPSNYLSLLLAQQNIDVAITGDSCPESEGLERRLILSEPTVVSASQKIAKQVQATSRNNNLFAELGRCNCPLIMYTRDNQGSLLHQTFLRRLYSSFPHKILIDRNAAMFALVSQGLGFAITRLSITVAMQQHYRQIVLLPTTEPLPTQYIYVLSRGAEFKKESKRIAQFSGQFVHEHLLPLMHKFSPGMAEKVEITPNS